MHSYQKESKKKIKSVWCTQNKNICVHCEKHPTINLNSQSLPYLQGPQNKLKNASTYFNDKLLKCGITSLTPISCSRSQRSPPTPSTPWMMRVVVIGAVVFGGCGCHHNTPWIIQPSDDDTCGSGAIVLGILPRRLFPPLFIPLLRRRRRRSHRPRPLITNKNGVDTDGTSNDIRLARLNPHKRRFPLARAARPASGPSGVRRRRAHWSRK